MKHPANTEVTSGGTLDWLSRRLKLLRILYFSWILGSIVFPMSVNVCEFTLFKCLIHDSAVGFTFLKMDDNLESEDVRGW